MIKNKMLVFIGIFTLIQGLFQIMINSYFLAQYYCFLDFFNWYPVLMYVKILYFANPSSCGNTFNIGRLVNELPDQAFILIQQEPRSVVRTFYFNVTNLALSFLWSLGSFIIIVTGARSSKPFRFLWIISTLAIFAMDIICMATYVHDMPMTSTLTDIAAFVGGILSGTGNVEVNTSWASWIMFLVHTRIIIFGLLNAVFFLVVIIKPNLRPPVIQEVEAPKAIEFSTIQEPSLKEESSLTVEEPPRIPRAGFSKSFRRMKNVLFPKQSLPTVQQVFAEQDSPSFSPERSLDIVQSAPADIEKKRTVNFPENLLSLPQRLENMIAEQQRRLDRALVDSAGQHSPPRASQSMPQLAVRTPVIENPMDVISKRGRRGTAVELQGQLPWSYIPAAHRMRDHLPPDEDLPPVPLPDYTAIPSDRKASVHRAASSLSSLTQKRDFLMNQPPRRKWSSISSDE